MNDQSSKIVTDALAGQMVQQTTVHFNLSQEAIIITEDKVRLCLHDHLARLEARKDWIAPLGVLLTLVLTFATTTFREWVFPAPTWQAIFVLATVGAGVWLAVTAIRALNAPTLENVVASMKRAGADVGYARPSSNNDA